MATEHDPSVSGPLGFTLLEGYRQCVCWGRIEAQGRDSLNATPVVWVGEDARYTDARETVAAVISANDCELKATQHGDGEAPLSRTPERVFTDPAGWSIDALATELRSTQQISGRARLQATELAESIIRAACALSDVDLLYVDILDAMVDIDQLIHSDATVAEELDGDRDIVIDAMKYMDVAGTIVLAGATGIAGRWILPEHTAHPGAATSFEDRGDSPGRGNVSRITPFPGFHRTIPTRLLPIHR